MGGGFRVLHLVRPFLPLLPQVQSSYRKIPFREKVVYHVISLFFFLVCGRLQLYGIDSTPDASPFYWMRLVLASGRGTVMELGITPVAASVMAMQLLAGSKIIGVDKDVPHDDRALLNGAQKLLGILIAVFEAVAYVMLSGIYAQFGIWNAMLVVFQLYFAVIVVIWLDELLQRGYGPGSGITLLIATSICADILWKAFCPFTVNNGLGAEFEGAVIALFHLLVTRTDKVDAVTEALYRQNLPNIATLLPPILIFLIIIHLQFFHVALHDRSKNARGRQCSYPFKLVYTSNLPLIVQTALFSNLYFISRFLYRKCSGNFFANLFAKWKDSEHSGGQVMPAGGVACYVTEIASLADTSPNPFLVLFCLVFMLGACTLIWKTWIKVSGSPARDDGEELKVTLGRCDLNPGKELNCDRPMATVFSEICIIALAVLTEFIGSP